MISLCSGCVHYYNFNCDKPMNEKALVKDCDHFSFIATKSFHNPKQLYRALSERPVTNPSTH